MKGKPVFPSVQQHNEIHAKNEYNNISVKHLLLLQNCSVDVISCLRVPRMRPSMKVCTK